MGDKKFYRMVITFFDRTMLEMNALTESGVRHIVFGYFLGLSSDMPDGIDQNEAWKYTANAGSELLAKGYYTLDYNEAHDEAVKITLELEN